MNLSELVTGTAGLLAALGSLLTGVAAITVAIRGGHGAKNPRKENSMRQPRGRKAAILPFLPGVFLLLLSGSIFAARAMSDGDQPLNVQLTQAAWDAFNKSDYDAAIASADKCLSEFRGSADREQAELENTKAPPPPKGKVSETEKKAIFAQILIRTLYEQAASSHPSWRNSYRGIFGAYGNQSVSSGKGYKCAPKAHK